jgi:hypothetical protein
MRTGIIKCGKDEINSKNVKIRLLLKSKENAIE